MSPLHHRALLALVLVLVAAGCAGHAPRPAAAPAAPTVAAPTDAWRADKPPALEGADRFEAPVPLQRALPNRLPVLVRENHAVPLVVVELVIRTGVDGDPPGKAGLADLLAATLDEGTRTRTTEQLAERLEDLAASLSISAGLDGIRLHLNCLTDTLEPALDLLADVALNPAFRPADLERNRAQTLTGLEQRRANPAALAGDEVARLLYGPKHPWGQPAGGTVQSVRALRRVDLVRFHDTYFRPNNALLSVSGDVDPDRIVRLLADRFGAWRPKALPPARLPPFPSETGKGAVVVDQPDATQTQVTLATRTVGATAPDVLALSAANVTLGGIFSSRLNTQLREVRGWTYGMFSGVSFNKRTGVFAVRGSVKAGVTVDALKDVQQVLKTYATGDVTDAEVAVAKRTILQNLPPALETNDAVASTFVTLSQLGRPLDWYRTLPARLGALTRDDVAKAAREHLSPVGWPVVLVGPTKDLDGLSALGLGPVTDRTAEVTRTPPAPPPPVSAPR